MPAYHEILDAESGQWFVPEFSYINDRGNAVYSSHDKSGEADSKHWRFTDAGRELITRANRKEKIKPQSQSSPPKEKHKKNDDDFSGEL